MTETAHARKQASLWDKIWKDKQGTGRVVIYQMPKLVAGGVGWVDGHLFDDEWSGGRCYLDARQCRFADLGGQ